jgi:hypothetical protein
MVLFILCIMPGQLLVAKQFPAISGLVQVKPGFIFLDIPIQLPVSIDLILAPALFFLIYPLVVLFYPSPQGMFSLRYTWHKVSGAFVGFIAILFFMLLGSGIYSLIESKLTTQMQTGLNSLGINAAVHLAYPKQQTINLQGGLLLFICFAIGMFIFIRKIRKEPARGLTREQRMSPYERMLQERRLQEKQQVRPERKIEMPPEIIPPYNHRSSHLCYPQPVRDLRPEARYYMPA